MKKTKIVEIKAKPAKEAIPAKTKKVTETVCDFCQANLPDHGSFGWYPKCTLCGRDICRKHTKFDSPDSSDYPDNYCTICFDLRFVKYGDAWWKLQELHEKEEEEFLKLIKKESLNESLIS